MLELADQFLVAQGGARLAKTKKDGPITDEKGKYEKGGNSHSPLLRCYICNRRNHPPHLCRYRPATKVAIVCFKCGKKGHRANDCRSGANNSLQASCFYAPRETREDPICDGYVELRNGEKVPVVNAVRVTPRKNLAENLPVATGTLRGTDISVLRDTGCNTVIVRRKLVKEDELTGTSRLVYLVDETARMLPEARIEVDTPYFTGNLTALCLQDPLHDLIRGNIDGVRPPNDPRKETEKPVSTKELREEPVAAAITRSQAHAQPEKFAKLRTPGTTTGLPGDNYGCEQRGDATLKQCFEKIGRKQTCRNEKGSVEFKQEQGLLYRQYTEANGRLVRQLVVLHCHREAVLKTAHDGIMAGHMGTQKTKDRISEEFFWPGITADVKRFVASCDICQRIVPKGRVPHVSLGRAPISDTPFKRVAIDIVGPIHPRSKHGNLYILTLMDYATRYPDAVALPSIETERVAEALVEMFSRFGVPREVLSDRGTNFTSHLMKEVARLLSVRQLHTTPYHPMANGLVEKFNGTLKLMLKLMCAERPRDWDRYLAPLLFAYMEVPQASTEFSPFELLYGRHVRGPLAILKELWTNADLTEEAKTMYQHVFDLRNRWKETCRLAHEDLEKAGARYAKLYNRKAKERSFNPEDKVLILLRTDTNKLLLQ
ncbi:uncharacterized protein LOC142772135 [Rhipicephalus microplus]|uniref:uncharacterized protein LOC142772135 n=1 Tax=Rhipicephalus microplus TaxID=6941 RepID=UPI003F6BF87D